jgi:hypothetical protein
VSCLDCATSAKAEHWGFTAGCSSCCARAASRTPHFRRVRDAGMQLDSQYRRLLAQFRLDHEQVRAAAAADRLEVKR